MARLLKDPFTLWLEARGHSVEVYQPGGMFGCPPMGWQVRLRRSSIAYVVRQEQPDTLIIIMFEREEGRSGLGSPFADFVRFVSLVKGSGTGITRIQGRVEAPEEPPPDSLDKARMTGFYHRHLGGKDVREGEQVEWVVGELDGLRMPLAACRPAEVPDGQQQRP